MTRSIHEGSGFAEGPVVLADDSIAFCDGTHGQIIHVNGGARTLADVGGGPNGLALGDDGALYVARIGPWRPEQRQAPPAVVRIGRDGEVAIVAREGAGELFVAPNDLAFGPDGRLYFTDSGDVDPFAPVCSSRIFALSDSGHELILDLGPVFANGIGFDPHERLVWTETTTRRICRLEGGRIAVIATLPQGHLPDGFAIASDGRIFVATLTSQSIVVIDAHGAILQPLNVGAEPTNCAFRGSELIVTASTDSSGDPGTGGLFVVPTDAEPLPLHRGRLGCRVAL
jgi:gluconolactonase